MEARISCFQFRELGQLNTSLSLSFPIWAMPIPTWVLEKFNGELLLSGGLEEGSPGGPRRDRRM